MLVIEAGTVRVCMLVSPEFTEVELATLLEAEKGGKPQYFQHLKLRARSLKEMARRSG